MFVIGLTGGIGCGKSSAAQIFARLGATVTDTDEIAHRLTQKDAPALLDIFREFGETVRLPDGSLDRAGLREKVFSDAAARKKLEALLHPLIRKTALAEIASARSAYTLLIIPLFFETGTWRELVDRVLVVDCAEDQQIARTMERSGVAFEMVRAIMACQISRPDRLKQADDVLSNDGSPEDLKKQVRALHRRYRTLALQKDANPSHKKRL